MHKRKKSAELGFVRKLINHNLDLKRLHPNEIYIFNVFANRGNYQIMVGPEYSAEECEAMKIEPHSRRIEINGTVHNLFLNPNHISAEPKQEDVRRNLRGSMIVKDLAIHIVDNNGTGTGIVIEKIHSHELVLRDKINLAGEKGEEMLSKYLSTGKLIMETYKIIQEDILNSLKPHK